MFVNPCQENSFCSISLRQPLSLARHGFHRSTMNEGLKRRRQEDVPLGFFLVTGNDRGLGIRHCHNTTSKQKKPNPNPKAMCCLCFWLPLQVTVVAVCLERGVLGSSLARAGIQDGCRDTGSSQTLVIRRVTALWGFTISVVIFVYLRVI